MSKENLLLYNHLRQLQRWQEEHQMKLRQQQAEQLEHLREQNVKMKQFLYQSENKNSILAPAFTEAQHLLLQGYTKENTCENELQKTTPTAQDLSTICEENNSGNLSSNALPELEDSANEGPNSPPGSIIKLATENEITLLSERFIKKATEEVNCKVDQEAAKPNFENFAELIETELQKFPVTPTDAASKPKHKFLKKGDGIARFKGKNGVHCKSRAKKLNGPKLQEHSNLAEIQSKDVRQISDKITEERQCDKQINADIDQMFNSTVDSDVTDITDSSFGVKVKEVAKAQKQEAVELDEFLTLEEAANFGSFNSSATLSTRNINTSTPETSLAHLHNESSCEVSQYADAEEEVALGNLLTPHEDDDQTLSGGDDNSATFSPIDMNEQILLENLAEMDMHAFPDHDVPCQTEKIFLNKLSDQSYVFDDENSWSDDTSIFDTQSESASTSYDFSKYVAEGTHEARISGHGASSPCEMSGYIASVFKNSKNQSRNEAPQKNALEADDVAEPVPKDDCQPPRAQTKLWTEKLQELEREINLFKIENNKLQQFKKEKAKELEGLINAQKNSQKIQDGKFRRMKEELDEERQNLLQERRKLSKEKQMFHQNLKTRRTKVGTTDTYEVGKLQAQVKDLQNDLNTKEKQWCVTGNRYKTRIGVLVNSNRDLKTEVQNYQKQREELYLKLQKKEKQLSDALRTNKRLVLLSAKKECQESAKRLANGKKYSDEEVLENKLSNKCSNEIVAHSDADNSGSEKFILKKLEDRIVKIFNDGRNEIEFANKTRKEISSDGRQTIYYYNGDVRKVLIDESVVYYYAEPNITQTTYPNGTEVIEFPNGQTEKVFPGGTKQVTYLDGTTKCIFPDGSEESVVTNGTIVKVDADRNEVIKFPNGQTEVHTSEFRRREYPDGTRKTLYSDGRQETQYSNGRIRVKDAEGKVIIDRMS